MLFHDRPVESFSDLFKTNPDLQNVDKDQSRSAVTFDKGCGGGGRGTGSASALGGGRGKYFEAFFVSL